MCFKTVKSLPEDTRSKQKAETSVNKFFWVFRPDLPFLLLILFCAAVYYWATCSSGSKWFSKIFSSELILQAYTLKQNKSWFPVAV